MTDALGIAFGLFVWLWPWVCFFVLMARAWRTDQPIDRLDVVLLAAIIVGFA